MSDEGTYSAEQVNQLLTCPVCLDRYNNPKILPCQHTVCRSPCMEGLIDRYTRMIKCPSCRAEHFVPRTGVDGFPTNITIAGFLDLQASARTASENEAPAPPQAAEADAEQAAGAAGGVPKKCAVCENEADSITKCFHCNKMVCQSCKQSHTGQMKMDVGRLVNQIRRTLPKLSNCISTVEHRGEVIKQHVTGVKSDVSSAIERFIKELKEREKLLHSELDTFQQGEVRSLRLHQETIEVELASISSYCDSMENFLNTNGNVPEADLVNIKHQCSEYMQQVRNIENEPMPPMRRSKFLAIEDALQREITHFGRIDVPPSLTITSPSSTSPNRSIAQQATPNRGGHHRARWGDRSPRVPGGTQPAPTTVRRPNGTNYNSTPRRFSPPPMETFNTGNRDLEDYYREHYLRNRDRDSPNLVTSINQPPSSFMEDRSLVGPFAGPSRNDDSWIRSSPGAGAHHSPSRSIYLPSRHEDYMYQMDTRTDDIVANYYRYDDYEDPYYTRYQSASSRNYSRDHTDNLYGVPHRSRITNYYRYYNEDPYQTPHWSERRNYYRYYNEDPYQTPQWSERTVLEEMRIQEEWELNASIRETARMRNNQQNANVLGTPTPCSRSVPNQQQERMGGLMGGGSPAVGGGGAVGASSNRGRGNNNTNSTTPRTTNVAGNQTTRLNEATLRELEDEIHNMDVDNTGTTNPTRSNNTTSTQGRVNQNTATQASRAAATAAIARSTNNGVSQVNGSQGGSSQTATAQTSPNNRTANQNLTNGRSGNQTTTNRTSNAPNNRSSNQNTPNNRPANQNTNNQNNRPNGPANRNGSQANNRGSVNNSNTQQTRSNQSSNRTVSNRNANTRNAASSSSGTNTNNNALRRNSNNSTSDTNSSSNEGAASNITPRPRRISQQQGPQGIARSRTFVQEEPTTVEQPEDLPSVSHNGMSFSIAFDDADTNEPSPATTGYSVNYHEKSTAVMCIGNGRGNGRENFTWPRGVVVSPVDSSIIVADSSNHRIKIYDATGNLTSTFGSYGTNEGEFDCLAGIAINTMGKIIVADRYNHRIQVLDKTGRFLHAFGEEGSEDGQLSYPWGVAADSSGFIYVCDKENHRIQVFQQNGIFVRKFGSLGSQPSKLENPHYVAITGDNKVIVSDSSNHRLQVFTNTGRFIKTIGSQGSAIGQLKYPKGIAIDPNGYIIVADSGNSRVQIFQPNGRYHYHFGSSGTQNGQFRGLEGLSLSPSGTIVVSDKDNHRIQTF